MSFETSAETTETEKLSGSDGESTESLKGLHISSFKNTDKFFFNFVYKLKDIFLLL